MTRIFHGKPLRHNSPNVSRLICLTFWIQMFCFGFSPGVYAAPSGIDQPASQTLLILKAYAFEYKSKFRTAARYWEPLSDVSAVARARQYENLMYANPEKAGAFPAVTEGQVLKTTRFLTWQKKWQAAQSVLVRYLENHERTPDLVAELITVYVLLGDYTHALDELKMFQADIGIDEIPIQLLRCWLAVLMEKGEVIDDQIQHFKENHLYIPGDMQMPGWFFPGLPSTHEGLIDLVRYPNRLGHTDDVVRIALKNKNWVTLDKILRSTDLVLKNQFTVTLQAELFARMGQKKRLQSNLTIQNKETAPSRIFFDHSAQLYSLTGDQTAFRRTIEAYIRAYPNLLDGYIYLIEYYEITGQLDQRDTLLGWVNARLVSSEWR